MELVRKPTREMREWHLIHAARQEKRRLGKRHPNRKGPGRQVTGMQGTFLTFPCPESLSLEDNFDGVVKLLSDLRYQSERQRNEIVYIDFKPIRELKPSGALVLAAELDRWNRLTLNQSRFKNVDLQQWNVRVRKLLGQMGFFDLLGVPGAELNHADSTVRYVKFRMGTKVDGKALEDLRKLEIEPAIEMPNRQKLFAAVTESMTNVIHHAYSDNTGQAPSAWWLSAAYDTDKGEVSILIYDQGLGIPKTLPRNFGERLREILPENLMRNDAQMIKAAHELKRTASEESHRGHGLQRDVREYIYGLPNGRYHVFSGKGEYTVTSGEEESLRSFSRPLAGTLIEWRIMQDA